MRRAAKTPQKTPRGVLILLGVCVALVLATAVIIISGSGDWVVPPEAKTLHDPVPVSAATLASGKKIYDDKCAECHGDKGDGEGKKAYKYFPSPSSFKDVHHMDGMTNGELYWKTTEGKRPMPSFKQKLTDQERWEVVNFIRTFSKPATENAAGGK